MCSAKRDWQSEAKDIEAFSHIFNDSQFCEIEFCDCHASLLSQHVCERALWWLVSRNMGAKGPHGLGHTCPFMQLFARSLTKQHYAPVSFDIVPGVHKTALAQPHVAGRTTRNDRHL